MLNCKTWRVWLVPGLSYWGNVVCSKAAASLRSTHNSIITFCEISMRMKRMLLGVSFILFAAAVQAEEAPRPNIVLIMVDDLGWSDFGCYGSEIQTPNIDRLASEGLRFTQFYNTAKCENSRVCLLSGLWAHEAQMRELKNCMTLAEGMRASGYTTLMTGKWHLDRTPVDRGFDRYFGHLSGATNFFTGDGSFRLDDKRFFVPKSGFYTTDANTDYAIKFLEQAQSEQKDKPFFLYIAYNAPHYPLQAWPEDIAKYRGKYSAGWDKLREARYARQLEMKLIDPQWKLAPRDKAVAAWETLSDAERDKEDLTMAVFAAMVDRVDQNIGRLMAKLQTLDEADNTIVILLSDNGGCPFQRTKTPDIPPGPAESYWTYHTAWAQVSNTPFRLYKQNQHEGGIATPLIVHWPRGVKNPGTITDQPGHLVDMMPTLLELAGGEYPESFNKVSLKPLRGSSLVPVLAGGEREPPTEIFQQFGSQRGLRMGKWKLVAVAGGQWELYDMEADRTELNNLAATMPERVSAMAKRWEELADRPVKRKGKAKPR